MTRSTNITKIILSTILFVYFIFAIQPWNLYFLNDDFVHIPLSAKTQWIHFQFFRPVANLLTAAEVKLFGTNSLGFHITSLLLHIFSTFCVSILCNQLIYKYGDQAQYKNAGFVAGCLFFIYPFHSEPLMWIIGRISMIATLFIIISIIFFLKRSQHSFYYLLSLLSFVIGLFSYEITWVVPGLVSVITLVEYLKLQKRIKKEILYLLPFWILFGIFLLLRHMVLRQLITEYEVLGRDMSVFSLVANFFRLLARTMVPPTQNTIEFIVIFSATIFVLLGFILFIAKRRAVKLLHVLLVLFLIISYLPTIAIGIDTHGSEGERYLYFPSVFWILLLTMLIYELSGKIGTYVFFLIAAAYSLLLATSALNYQHASHVAKNILSVFNNRPAFKKIIAINIPANYRGAMIFRSGFAEAIDWMYPHMNVDTIIVVPAKRTYEKISLPVKIIKKEDLTAHYIKASTSDNKNYTLYFKNRIIEYNSTQDLLIFFNETGVGEVLYPHP
ncbi:MAG: hypothetical protein H7122_21255 [Chitinophagaceae bacterium]|nr:hypothetical protein [Chitinophagaceae bacterium]